MIETIGDFVSVICMVFMTIGGIMILFRVSVEHRAEVLRRREERYYRYYEDAVASDDEDNGDLYYGDDA